MFAFVKAFIAGALSVPTFHQGMLWLLAAAGLVAATPWNLAPVAPFDLPALISLAFWGGLWGLVIWALIRNAQAAGYYVGALILGAVLPSIVALTLVTALKQGGLDAVLGGLSPGRIGVALALNGAWGLGVAVFMRFLHPPR